MLTHTSKVKTPKGTGKKVSDVMKYFQKDHEECPQCHKMFESHTLCLTSEMLRYTNKPYNCCMCSKSCRLPSFLKSHIRAHFKRKHCKNTPHVCSVCRRNFTTACLLRKHMKNHLTDKLFKCTICSKAFKMNGQLRTHVKVHTGYEKPFCHRCRTYFTTYELLSEHLHRTHEDESQQSVQCEPMKVI